MLKGKGSKTTDMTGTAAPAAKKRSSTKKADATKEKAAPAGKPAKVKKGSKKAVEGSTPPASTARGSTPPTSTTPSPTGTVSSGPIGSTQHAVSLVSEFSCGVRAKRVASAVLRPPWFSILTGPARGCVRGHEKCGPALYHAYHPQRLSVAEVWPAHTHTTSTHTTLCAYVNVQAGNKIGGKSGINWAALDKGERCLEHVLALKLHLLALKPSTDSSCSYVASRLLCRPHTHMHISQSRRTMCIRTPHTFVFLGRCFAASSH
jgi:hypothetical protein